MDERGSKLYHIIGEVIAIGNMLQLLQSEKNQLLMQQSRVELNWTELKSLINKSAIFCFRSYKPKRFTAVV